MIESELADEAEWITECMARLFIHSRLFQCSRFYGDGISALDKCPGRGKRRILDHNGPLGI